MKPTSQPLTWAVLSLWLALFSLPARAQSLDMHMTAEYDIGFECPVSSTLTPDTSALWVLMNNCGTGDFSLHAFDPATGAPLTNDPSRFTAVLSPMDDAYMYAGSPVAFTPDGALDIFYNAGDDYDIVNLRVQVDSAAAAAPSPFQLNLESVNRLIPGYAGYLETTAYNADHTAAVVMDDFAYHVIDLQTGAEILKMDEPGGTDITYPSFSHDGQRLYIARFDHPDDYEDYSGTLSIYSLPDGELLQAYAVPSALLWVSPNEQYAAFIIGSSDGSSDALGVVELASGAVSPMLSIHEPPSKLMACANDGRSMSDVDFTKSGRLALKSLNWLPDSSGFLTVNSYGGEAAGGGRPCFFNYSRLRRYSIG